MPESLQVGQVLLQSSVKCNLEMFTFHAKSKDEQVAPTSYVPFYGNKRSNVFAGAPI